MWWRRRKREVETVWWRRNKALQLMANEPETYRRYLYMMVYDGNQLWLCEIAHEGEILSCILCGEGEDASLMLGFPPDVRVKPALLKLIEALEGDDIGRYVDRALSGHQLKVRVATV